MTLATVTIIFLAIFSSVVLGLLLITVTQLARKTQEIKSLREKLESRTPEIRKYTLPAFGDPVQAPYRSDDYEESLRCAGKACGNRQLVDGESFYQIPLMNQGDGAILALCLRCGHPSLKEA